MTLAYIGPGPGWLLDPQGPGPYLLGVLVLLVIWFVVSQVRSRRGGS